MKYKPGQVFNPRSALEGSYIHCPELTILEISSNYIRFKEKPKSKQNLKRNLYNLETYWRLNTYKTWKNLLDMESKK